MINIVLDGIKYSFSDEDELATLLETQAEETEYVYQEEGVYRNDD